MKLDKEVDEKRREIRTDAYDMSIGELCSLYEDGEIDIHPEFQRFFRWTDRQKSQLIESILLGIPIPPIFVSQRADGVWDVVDGLQRLSTIYQFMGMLKDENGKIVKPLVLSKTKYLPSLEGKQWNGNGNGKNAFSQSLRLLVKRSKLSVSIILKESDENAKYDLFQRLNAGGSHLSPQEIRNCILVMINKNMFRWLKNLAEYEPFRNCAALSDRPISESYDIELALRFVIFSCISEDDLSNVGDVHVYITDKMTEIASQKSFSHKTWSQLFRQTFDLLEHEVGDKAFKRYDNKKKKFSGGFLISQFELVACGCAYNLYNDTIPANIEGKIMKSWSDPGYTKWTGSGITAARRLPRLIPYGREVFSDGR